MISTYAKMLALFQPAERKRFWILAVLVVVAGFLEISTLGAIFPFMSLLSDPGMIESNRYMALVYERLGFESTLSFQIFAGVSAFVIIMLGLALRAGTMYLLIRFSTLSGYSLASRLLQGSLHRPYVWFLDRNSSDSGKTILEEVQRLINGVILPAMQLMASAALVVLLAGMLVVVEPVGALITVGLMGASYVVIFLTVRGMLNRIGQDINAANAQRFRITQEAVGGIKDVKLMHLEETYTRLFNGPALRFSRGLANSRILGQLPRFLLEGIAFGGIIVMLLVLLVRTGGDMDKIIPLLGFFAFAGLRLFPAMQQIYQQMAALKTYGPLLDRILADLQEVRADRESWIKGPAPNPLRLKDALSLQDITFRYPTSERAVLNGLTMTIPAGTRVGIVGGTGAGKTTAIDILLGLLSAQDGDMQVDGVPVTEQSLPAWQRNIGYVPQQIFLADDTVRANIAFGQAADQIDQAQVEAVAKIAELHEFILNDLDNGYDSITGERGIRLSGGQRQRIGIARALYHDPDVLILDEATSALDNVTEAAVMRAVHNMGADKTVIMIAHRLSTVEACDIIFYLEKGKVAAQGTYQELLAASPGFRAMAEAPTQAAS